MLVLEIVLAALVVFGVAAVAMGYGGSITHFAPDWPGRSLPEDRTVRADDVSRVRFSLAFRGYRMHEVDATLETLAAEIAKRDARIEQLTGQPFESSDAPDPAADGAVRDQATAADQHSSFDSDDQSSYAPPVYHDTADDASR